MEINYNTIIRYLTPEYELDKNNDNNDNAIKNKLCRKNIIGDLNFLNSDLKELLKVSGKFYRIGVTNKILEKNKYIDISFFSSILTVFDNKFVTLDENETSTYIKKFIEQIKESITKTSFKFNLKFKFPKNVLMDRILDFDFDDGLIYQVLVQLLDINLIIFELNKETEDINISSLFSENTLNAWKPTIILHKYNNSFELILTEKNKHFSINDLFLKYMYEKYYNDIKYFNETYLDKEFSIIDDSQQIINDFINDNTSKEELNDNQDIQNDTIDLENTNQDDKKLANCLESSGLIKRSSEIDDDSEEELSPNEDKPEEQYYNKTKLKNMKKDEILELITKNKKIFVHFSKPQKLTKGELIEKFVFFQNMLQNQNSVQSSSS